MGCVQSYFKKAQSGLSPSSTEEYTNKAPVVVQAGERKASEGDVSTDKPPEEPESNDTSYGVEATAIRTLAASTGTVAILGTTAKTASSVNGDEDEDEGKEEVKDSVKDEETSESTTEDVATEVKKAAETKKEPAEAVTTNKPEYDSNSTGEIDEGVKIVEELHKIVDAESAQQETKNSVDIENENSVSDRVSSEESGSKDDLKEPISEITMIAVDTDLTSDAVENQLPEEPDVSAHSLTREEDENDISSEQLKTNSLSDVSISEMEDRSETAIKAEVGPSKDPAKAVEDESKEIESLVRITLDEPKEFLSEDKNDPQVQKDNTTVLNEAATTIQSNFRGYQVRKNLKSENDDSEGRESPKLTDSLIENIKAEVDGIIKEAEVKTESLINSPVTDEFPAPPEDMLLEARKGDEDTKLVSEIVAGMVNAASFDSNEDSEAKHASENSNGSEVARMTADEDLPAPDFEMLESSSTDDINTEIINNSLKGTEDELRDSTEGDLTLDEISEKLKEPTRQQEYSELKLSPSGFSDVQHENTPSQDTTSSLLSQELFDDDNAQLDAHSPLENGAKDGSLNSTHDPDEIQTESGQKAANGDSLRTISTDESGMTSEHSNNSNDATSAQGSLGNTNLSEGPVHLSAYNSNLSSEDAALDSTGDANLSEDLASSAVDVAATKIQAQVRGYLTRKHIDTENKTDSAGKVETIAEMDKEPETKVLGNSKTEKNEKENHQNNCESKTSGSDSNEAPDDRNKRKLDGDSKADEEKTEEPEPAVDEKLMNNSAAKIQAGVRGFLVRKRQKTLKESPQEDTETITQN